MTTVDTDIDLTLLFDFDAEFKCESLAKDCPETAHWNWHFKCCDRSVLLCNSCDEISCRIHLVKYAYMICHFCKTHGKSKDYLERTRI